MFNLIDFIILRSMVVLRGPDETDTAHIVVPRNLSWKERRLVGFHWGTDGALRRIGHNPNFWYFSRRRLFSFSLFKRDQSAESFFAILIQLLVGSVLTIVISVGLTTVFPVLLEIGTTTIFFVLLAVFYFLWTLLTIRHDHIVKKLSKINFTLPEGNALDFRKSEVDFLVKVKKLPWRMRKQFYRDYDQIDYGFGLYLSKNDSTVFKASKIKLREISLELMHC